MQAPLVELKNLSTFTPDGHTLSEAVSLSLKRGEILLIEGDNGSGKTTLARAVLGLHRHFTGEILCDTETTAYLPQMGDAQSFLSLTVEDVVTLKVDGGRQEILRLGLINEASLSHPWNTASGGERQKALLTRVLLSPAQLLILDEPFNHLDPGTRAKAAKAISTRVEAGAGVIIVSHLSSDDLLRCHQRLTLSRRVGGEA